MRKVQYKHWKTGETIVASFHQWAQDNDGDGNPCPVALVEHSDGRVDTVYAGHITFVDAGGQPADELKDASHELKNARSAEVQGDFAVLVEFASCRSACAFAADVKRALAEKGERNE